MKRFMLDFLAIMLAVFAAEVLIRLLLPTLMTQQDGVQQR